MIFSCMNYSECAAAPSPPYQPHFMKRTRKAKSLIRPLPVSTSSSKEALPVDTPLISLSAARGSTIDVVCCLTQVFLFTCVSPDGCNLILWHKPNRFFRNGFFRSRFFFSLQCDLIFLRKGGILIFLNEFTHQTRPFSTGGCESLSRADLHQPRATERRAWGRVCFAGLPESGQRAALVCGSLPTGGVKKAREAFQRKGWAKMHKQGCFVLCMA